MARVLVLLSIGSLVLSGYAQTVDLSVHGFRSDVTVPISDLTKRSLEYYDMGSEQMHEMNFSARVSNDGSATATGIYVSVELLLDGEDAGAYSSLVLDSLLPGSSDTLVVYSDWDIPVFNSANELQICFQVQATSSDTILANSFDTAVVRIDHYWRFCRSDSQWDDTISMHGSDDRVLVRYEVTEDTYAYAILVVLPTVPVPEDAFLWGQLLDEEFNELSDGELFVYPSTMSDPGEAFWRMMVIDGQDLYAGHDYFLSLSGYPPNTIVLASAGSCADSSVYRANYQMDTLQALDKLPLVGIMTNSPEVIPEGGSFTPFSFRLEPNPANDEVHVSFNLRSRSDVSIQIRTLSGGLAQASSLGHYSPGSHGVTLDLADLAPAVYVCILDCGGQEERTRLVVFK